jgi:hypothetical protein
VKVEKLAKNGQMVQNSQPLSPNFCVASGFAISFETGELRKHGRACDSVGYERDVRRLPGQ